MQGASFCQGSLLSLTEVEQSSATAESMLKESSDLVPRLFHSHWAPLRACRWCPRVMSQVFREVQSRQRRHRDDS